MAAANQITALRIPQAIKERGTVEVGFRFARDQQGFDIVAAEVATPIGVLQTLLPASHLGIEGREGAGRLMLDLRGLPGGLCTLSLTPVLASGERGEGASGELQVPRFDSRAPSAPRVHVVDPKLQRPRAADQVFVRADLAIEPGDSEVTAVWAWWRGPAGAEWASVVAWPPANEDDGIEPAFADDGNPSSTASVAQPREPLPRSSRITLATLGAGTAAGAYEAAVHLVDAAGQTSAPLLVKFQFVERGGALGPSVASFKPAQAAEGDEVVVRGDGFEVDDLRVEVGGVIVGVLHADEKVLRIRMPELAAPGRVVVSCGRGVGSSEGWLAPRVRVRVVPEVVEIAEGSKVQLTALVQGTHEGKVRWALRSRAGRPGSISPDGVYSPPAGGLRDEVVVTATHAGDKAATASARLRGVAQPAARGPLPIGPMGGTVRSQDDGCALSFPAGALARLRSVAIEAEEPGEGDEPAGRLVVAQVRIAGAPRDVGQPVELTMRLRHPLPPGQTVRLRWRDSPGVPWTDLPPFLEIVPGEEALKLRLESLHPHFQGVIEYAPKPPTQVPHITSVAPSAIDEGATVALWVKGSNFVPGVTTVTVHKDTGQLEPRVLVRQVHVAANGTQLGVTVKAGVMTELPEGDLARLRLHVTTPAGTASIRLDVLGHDELDVPPGGTATLLQSRTFSRVNVAPGATLRLAHRMPPVRIEAHETLIVGNSSGRATVEVLTGTGGSGTLGTTAPAFGAGGFGGLAPAAGTASSGGAGGSGGFSGTFGGNPGVRGSNGPGRTGGAGGTGGRPAPFLGSATDGAGGSAPVITFPFSLNDVGVGAGGGGGGGGGGEGVVFKTTGGGGGGGGAGGGAFRLAAGEEVRVVGRVQANGGDGGAGAFPFAVGFPPAPPLMHAGCGGGGAGGSGGGVGLYGVRLLNGEVLAVGGTPGSNARFAAAVITVPDTRTPLQRLLANPFNGITDFDGVAGTLTATVAPAPLSIPDLDFRADLVSPNPQLNMTGFGSGQLLVTDPAGNQQVLQVSGQPFAASVPLAPGFNLIEGALASVINTSDVMVDRRAEAMRRRRVLFLPGTVPVFTFNCTITPAAPVVATERSVALTATVTGTTLTAVTWEVDGGASNGAVSPAGVYRAPCDVPPPGAATVRVRSAFDPSRSAAVNVTVLPGIALNATATAGTPKVAGQPSANVGQAITVRIPAATLPMTTERFVAAQSVVFETHARDAAGGCTDGTATATGTVAPGLTQMTVVVPPCAAPEQHLRVPGHGCARLQIVPRITSLNRSAALGSNMGINGSGFVCGSTEVFFGNTPVPAAQVLSVDCAVILLGTRPAAGQAVTVRTAGGTSNAVS